MRSRIPRWLGWVLVGAGVLLILIAAPDIWRAAVPLFSPTAEPFIPTRTPAASPTVVLPSPLAQPAQIPTSPASRSGEGSPTIAPPTRSPMMPSATPTGKVSPPAPTLLAIEPTRVLPSQPAPWTFHGLPRWGIGVAVGPVSRYNITPLRLGWYLDWHVHSNPPRPGGVEYVQVVRLRDGQLQPGADTLAATARANPGSLWLIGNEPDVKWQDNTDPITYARLYHEAYRAIEEADPTARIAIGGVSQPTPLRRRYLDAVLTAYREQFGSEMPVDVWNVHNFILREERGSWGVDIPPGLPDDRGMLYEIDDCDNLEIFRRQVVDFRRWMAERGFQNHPLIVSEYGIPMPEDYGFPPERVIAFLRGTFEFFLTASDPSLGYPGDGYRLVQRWAWYSLDAPDTYYPQGRLFDPATGAMTAVGEGWVSIVEQFISGGER